MEVAPKTVRLINGVKWDLSLGTCEMIGDLGDPHLGTDVVKGASGNLLHDSLFYMVWSGAVTVMRLALAIEVP